jgi:hypothetical protein
MKEAKLQDRFEVAHAQTAIDLLRAGEERARLIRAGKLQPLPEASEKAAEDTYVRDFKKLFDGLSAAATRPAKGDEDAARVEKIWNGTAAR